MRRPMVSVLERNASGTSSDAFTISVRGPGQNVRASTKANSGTQRPKRARSSCWETSHEMGFAFSRRFRLYRISGDAAWRIETPRPYTVSVGKIAGCPFLRTDAVTAIESERRANGTTFSSTCRSPYAQCAQRRTLNCSTRGFAGPRAGWRAQGRDGNEPRTRASEERGRARRARRKGNEQRGADAGAGMATSEG